MSEKISSYIRFSLAQRVEHIILVISFSLLGLTGLPQKYPLSPISQGIVDAMGGIESIRVIHRIAATVFLIEAIYHLVLAGYKLYVRREEASMVPTLKDGTDAIQAFLYNLGLRKEGPKMPRYNFAEKAEYWAMLWGLLVMAVTGFMLWNPIITTNLLPGEFIPAAKVAHGGEAVLAVLAIILWHFYNVHIRFFNKSMFTGKLDHHAMAEEHGLELEKIKAGKTGVTASAAEQRERMTIYVPVASILSLVFLAGVYWFVTFEQSSLTTLPPAQQAQVLVTQTPTPQPPTPTPAPTQEPQAGGEAGSSAVGWNGDLDGVFQTKCGTCHGTTGGFSAATYADVMQAVEPGNPQGSPLVQAQSETHPGMFSEEEINRVVEWIQAGAPEQGSGEPAGETGGEPATWSGEVAQLFKSQCGACHGSIGGFSSATYEEVMQKIETGDSDASPVVVVQQKGNHPGKFTAAQLQVVIDWIQAGAPE